MRIALLVGPPKDETHRAFQLLTSKRLLGAFKCNVERTLVSFDAS